MHSMTFRTRLGSPLARGLLKHAADWQQPISAVIRDAVAYLLAHPECYPEMLAARDAPREDTRTEAQKAAGEQYLQSLAGYDLAADLGHSLIT